MIKFFSLKDLSYEAAHPLSENQSNVTRPTLGERFHRLFSSFLNILAERKTWKERRIEDRGRMGERETDVTGMTKKVISAVRNPVTREIEDATENH